MNNVSNEERDYMQNLMNILDGGSHNTEKQQISESKPTSYPVELAGPGAVTQADVDAMTQVMSRLDSLASDMVADPEPPREFAQALMETRNRSGLKVGNWQISVHEDATRLAGKQYYSIYHSETNQIIANDISLYETALKVARLLNSGEFVNGLKVRELFEQDDSYTSHKIDAHRFYIRSRKSQNRQQRELYESRMQASRDRAMQLRQNLKKNLDI